MEGVSLLDRPRLAPLRRLRSAIAHNLDHLWAPSHMDDYLDDELSHEQRRRMEHHVDECPQCSQALAALRTLLGGLTGLRRRAPQTLVETVIERLRAEVAREERRP